MSKSFNTGESSKDTHKPNKTGPISELPWYEIDNNQNFLT